MHVPAGTVFASLTVIREIDRSGSNRRFLCQCACGTEAVKFLNNLRLGRSTSCGCTYERGAVGRARSWATRRAKAQVTADGRMCHTCNTWKPWPEFYDDPRRLNGKSSNCIDCTRWRRVMNAYGIKRSEWERMRDRQQGGCALCGEPGRLMVDHDHSCCGDTRGCNSCIRGLLCDFCNRVLGRIEQKSVLAERFADYLQRRPLIQ